jgi:hypothetical protein
MGEAIVLFREGGIAQAGTAPIPPQFGEDGDLIRV